MDWDFNKAMNENEDIFQKGVREGGQMESDAVKWIADKLTALIHSEMMNARTDKQRAALTAAMPMLSAAGIFTFVQIAGRPEERHKLQAQHLMLSASIDFMQAHLARTTKQLEKLQAENPSPDPADIQFNEIQNAIKDLQTMDKTEWVRKYGGLAAKIEKMKKDKGL